VSVGAGYIYVCGYVWGDVECERMQVERKVTAMASIDRRNTQTSPDQLWVLLEDEST
jgi:hypothetical protein